MVISKLKEEMSVLSEEKRKMKECITEMEEALGCKNEEHNKEMENIDAEIALFLEKIVLLARQNFELECQMSTHDITQKSST